MIEFNLDAMLKESGAQFGSLSVRNVFLAGRLGALEEQVAALQKQLEDNKVKAVE